jgi:cytochrome bd ubiquinol oxidase subunit II
MHLSDGWMIFVILALTMHVVLDGSDLGIGVLTLFERDDRRRRDMLALVAWLWDGNECWRVLVALTLCAGMPLVAGVALPALYIALIPMLWSLIARGVSLELIDQHEGWHPLWGKVFGIGSLLAGFCQGAAFGGLVAALVIALHDRQSPAVPWTPTARVELAPAAATHTRSLGRSSAADAGLIGRNPAWVLGLRPFLGRWV